MKGTHTSSHTMSTEKWTLTLFIAGLVLSCSNHTSSRDAARAAGDADSARFEDTLGSSAHGDQVAATTQPSSICGVNLGLSGSKPQDRPSECGEGFESAYLYSECIKDSSNSCKNVRFAAIITDTAQNTTLFGVDSAARLGITDFEWKLDGLPSGVTCQTTDSTNAYNPLCTSGTSLKETTLAASLRITTSKSTFLAKSNAAPASAVDSGYRNFIKIRGDSKLSPTQVLYPGATAKFTEIWKDLISGIYVTNVLYDGTGSTNWSGAKAICESINGWRLPTMAELCGPGYGTERCDGGLAQDGFDAPIAIDELGRGPPLWSSTMAADNPALPNSSSAWLVTMSTLTGQTASVTTNRQVSVVCVKN